MTRKHIHGGDIYRHPNVLDFSANCNPYGMPEGVKEAAAAALKLAEHYPDVSCTRLRMALSKAEQMPVEQILCGNGAADLIFALALAKKPKKALLLAPTFAEYQQALESVDCEIHYAYLREEHDFVPGEEILYQITEDLDMMFFCNPNNPTGVLASRDYVIKIVEKLLPDHIKIVTSGNAWMDIQNKNINKGIGMAFLQSLYNIKPEECMAFGDQMNDYELLQQVKYGYAMENAVDSIKEIAYQVIDSNDNQGVIRKIKEILEI